MVPALRDPDLLRSQAFVAGAWVEGPGPRFDSRDPADGASVGSVPDLGPADAVAAVEAAAAALPGWRARTAKERAVILRRFADLMVANVDDLAALMTAEQGKPLAEAAGEVRYAAAFLEWAGEEGKRAYGQVIPTFAADRRVLVVKQPAGVTVAITPWNFPFAMITRKAGFALAAGCPMIVKPAEDTPLCALALAVLAERAGVPAGVFQVLTTTDAAGVGAVLTTHPAVQVVSFTGSTEVGRILMAQCASTVKRVALELGGNAPFVVFDDADLDAAVTGAIASKYRNAGQTCVCANRFLVQDGVADAFAAKLAAATEALRVGRGDEAGVAIGPLINAEALAKVERLVADAVDAGATVLTGGERHPRGGTFFTPTVLDHVSPSWAIAREEIFGPVAPITRFATEADAIRLANDTPFGLAAYVYARDIGRVWRVAEGLDYGMVGINEGLISTEVAPFGGMKQSGIGREGSQLGLEEYLETKYLCMGGITPA